MQQTNYTHIPSELSPEQQYMFMTQTYEQLPNWVRTMFQKKKGTHYFTKDLSMEAAWIQLHENDRHWLIVDFDNRDEWDWKKLPLAPNIVSYNTNTGNHQVFYRLRDHVHCHPAAKKKAPYRYLRGLEKSIDLKYGGDQGFSRCVSKNPFHPQWDTIWIHDRKFSLKELEIGLEVNTKVSSHARRKTSLEGREGRNSAIFDEVRFKSYKEVGRYKNMDAVSFNDWNSIVLEWCHRGNSFDGKSPIGDREIISTAKSIASFCWYRYTPPEQKEKKIPMTKDEIKIAQRNAQKMTKAKQIGRTESALKEAIRQLKNDGKKVSKAAAAKIAGVSRAQASTKYSYLFD
jgi:hypothetical protein